MSVRIHIQQPVTGMTLEFSSIMAFVRAATSGGIGFDRRFVSRFMCALIATHRHRVKRDLELSATDRYLFPGMDLPSLVKARLDSKGWTREVFAKRAGLSTSGLRKILRGQVREVSGPTVNGLAKALGVEPARVRAAIEASRK